MSDLGAVGGRELDLAAAHNGGTARGYQDFFGPLATRQSRVATRLQPRLAVFLYIAMLEVNVLNCRAWR
jgi:hypothetical protein